MRIVLDTNVLITRLLSPTSYAVQIFTAWEAYAFEVVVSEHILGEYERALRYEHLRLDEERSKKLLTRFAKFATLVIPTETLHVVKEDPQDNKFVECAIAGEAGYIVSSDKDLPRLKEYRGVQILSPAQFLELLQHEQVT